MSYEFRPPSITEGTPEGQLRQTRSYLVKLAGQLTWAFGNLRGQKQEGAEGGLDADALFRSIRGRLRKERQRMVSQVSWAVGSAVAAPEWVAGCTVYLAVAGETPILCARHGTAIRGENFAAEYAEGLLTLTTAPATVTRLQGLL